jgi:hypothetical protein
MTAQATNPLSACYALLEQANNQLDVLGEPCQSAIIVNTAIGLVGNGGFPYFFEMDFPGNPPYERFTEAFRRVGLVDIAERFAQLVSLFPFDAPHASRALRQQFLDKRPREFDAAMTQLEDLIYALEDSDTLLERHIQGLAP